jgi:hypothetical protein
MNNSLDSLRPQFRQVAVAWSEIVKAYLIPIRFPGYRMRITETLRSPERQVELESTGKSKVKVGWHNYGLALDFALTDDSGVYVANGADPAYLACGQVAEAFRCVWGGRWASFMDASHLEFHPGFTLEQMIAADKIGKDLLTT